MALPNVVASLRDEVRVNIVTACSLLDACALVTPWCIPHNVTRTEYGGHTSGVWPDSPVFKRPVLLPAQPVAGHLIVRLSEGFRLQCMFA